MPREREQIIERPPPPRPDREGDLIRKIDREDAWPPPPSAPGAATPGVDEDDRESTA